MKILNLDAYTSVKRQLRYKGVLHGLVQISVQEFIDACKATEDQEAAAEADAAAEAAGASPEVKAAAKVRLSEAVERMVKGVLEGIPSLPESEVRAMPVHALKAILDFIRGELDGEAEDTAKDGSDPK